MEGLLRYGADCNARDAEQSTPLMYACRQSLLPVVRLLLRAGGDVSLKDLRGMTALMHAAGQDAPAILKELLLLDPVSLNDRDASGWTALHWACAVSSRACIGLLLSMRRIRVGLATARDETPLHLAARNGDSDVCNMLVLHSHTSNGLSLLMKTSDTGATPYQVALSQGFVGTAMELASLQQRLDDRFKSEQRTGGGARVVPKVEAGLAWENQGFFTPPSAAWSQSFDSHSSSELGGTGVPKRVRLESDTEGSKESEPRGRKREFLRVKKPCAGSVRGSPKELAGKVGELEKENASLSVEVSQLREEAARLRAMLAARQNSLV